MNEGILDELHAEGVLDIHQFEELKSYKDRPIKAMSELLQMILKGSDKQASSFMSVLKTSQIDYWSYTKIQKEIQKLKTGETSLFRQPDLKGKKLFWKNITLKSINLT